MISGYDNKREGGEGGIYIIHLFMLYLGLCLGLEASTDILAPLFLSLNILTLVLLIY